MNDAIVRKTLTAAVVFLMSAAAPAGQNFVPKTAVLHATVSITGGVSLSESYDYRLRFPKCADVAELGTSGLDGAGNKVFQVPIPSPGAGPFAVGGGRDFATDAAVWRYRGPGSYAGPDLSATDMSVATRPDDQETHHFAFPKDIGRIVVNADASGSFEFSGLQDPGKVTISGQVTWTCSAY